MGEVRVTVTSAGSSGSVNATNNAAQYWSDKAREWAISESTVSGEDNSSKWYANKSKQYKEEAESAVNGFNSTVESATTEFNTLVSGAESDINGLTSDFSNLYDEKSEALQSEYTGYSSNLDSTKDTAILSISTAGTTALNDITTAKNTAVGAVQSEGTTQIDAIEAKGQEQIDNIEQTGFFMQNGKLYYIDENGETQEFKSGSGLEVCDISMALYVDESKGLRRYLNGQIVVNNTNTSAFITKLQSIIALHPSLACTESEWQAAKTLSAFGQVGKFVLNYATDGTTVESVRLPAVVNIQGLFDLQNLGMTVEAGLPTLTTNSNGAHYHYEFNTDSGSGDSQAVVTASQYPHYKGKGGYSSYNIGGSSTASTVGRSSTNGAHTHTIAGTSTTVQPEAIQYPYFIQIATGVEEENIINNYEVANPYFYGYSIYSKTNPDNACWLQSSGQWNSGTVYTGVYEWALTQLNSGVSGFKAAGDSTITDFDWVVDTANTQFRFPLLNGSEDIVSNKFDDLTSEISNTTYKAPANGWYAYAFTSSASNQRIALFNFTSGTTDTRIGSAVCSSAAGQTLHIQIPVKKGDNVSLVYPANTTSNYFNFIYAQGNGTLYYYIGNVLQNPDLVNIARIEEELPTKLDKSSVKSYVTESYQNGSSWYRIYSDNWIEQGGCINKTSETSPVNFNITFLKNFLNTNYYRDITIFGAYSTTASGGIELGYKDHMTGFIKNSSGNVSTLIFWIAAGYKA